MVAVIAVVGGQAHAGAAFNLYAPVLPGPPGITHKETGAPPGALLPPGGHLRVQPQGKFQVPHIEVGIHEIGSHEYSLEHFVEVISAFRRHQEVTPVGGVVHIVVVPGQETGPAFEASVHTHGEVVSYLEFQAGVYRTGSVVQQIVTDRHFLPCRSEWQQGQKQSTNKAKRNGSHAFYHSQFLALFQFAVQNYIF